MASLFLESCETESIEVDWGDQVLSNQLTVVSNNGIHPSRGDPNRSWVPPRTGIYHVFYEVRWTKSQVPLANVCVYVRAGETEVLKGKPKSLDTMVTRTGFMFVNLGERVQLRINNGEEGLTELKHVVFVMSLVQ